MDSKNRIPTIDLENSWSSFLIRPLRRNVDPQVMKERPHRHNYQELIWVKSGSGKQRIDDVELEIRPLTFYLIPKGQIHFFTEGNDLEGFLIRFSDDFLLDSVGSLAWNYRQTLFSHFTIHRSLQVLQTDIRRYEGLLLRMWQEHQTREFGFEALQRHLLSILLIQLERSRLKLANEQVQPSREGVLYKEFLDSLEAHYRTEHSVAFYSETLGISARKLTQLCRFYAGLTAKRLIQDRVILEAQRFLQHTNLSIKEISFRLGFRDPAYFSKAFKAVVGVAPQAYETHQYKSS